MGPLAVVCQNPHGDYGEWIRLFRSSGLVVDDLVEPRPAADAIATYREESERDWARRWPSEAVWKAGKA